MLQKLTTKMKLFLLLLPVIVVMIVSFYTLLATVVTSASSSQVAGFLSPLRQPVLRLQERLGGARVEQPSHPTPTLQPAVDFLTVPEVNRSATKPPQITNDADTPDRDDPVTENDDNIIIDDNIEDDINHDDEFEDEGDDDDSDVETEIESDDDDDDDN